MNTLFIVKIHPQQQK